MRIYFTSGLDKQVRCVQKHVMYLASPFQFRMCGTLAKWRSSCVGHRTYNSSCHCFCRQLHPVKAGTQESWSTLEPLLLLSYRIRFQRVVEAHLTHTPDHGRRGRPPSQAKGAAEPRCGAWSPWWKGGEKVGEKVGEKAVDLSKWIVHLFGTVFLFILLRNLQWWLKKLLNSLEILWSCIHNCSGDLLCFVFLSNICFCLLFNWNFM